MKTAHLTIMLSGVALADMNNTITLVQERDARTVRMEHRIPEVLTEKKMVDVSRPQPTVAGTDRMSNRQFRRALRKYVKTDHPIPEFWEATQ
jgi:hypothetical protein